MAHEGLAIQVKVGKMPMDPQNVTWVGNHLQHKYFHVWRACMIIMLTVL